ncbi:MAG: cell division protein FtsL [Clostridia bacterium]
MAARKLYDDYYEDGSAAKKIEKKQKSSKTYSKSIKTNTNKEAIHKHKKNNAVLIMFILGCFVMTMVITYRFNVINEKNLKAQSLKKELVGAETGLANSQIDVEKNTDLNKIEAYAKQQLGMQKPDKNQTIYVDTSKTGTSVEVEQDATVVEKIMNAIRNALESIF